MDFFYQRNYFWLNNLSSFHKMKILAGVDEVGRGSLIGPVFAAAVIFKKNIDKKKIKDSKQLSKGKRDNLEKYIKKKLYLEHWFSLFKRN